MNGGSAASAPHHLVPVGPLASLLAFVIATVAGFICGFVGIYGLIIVPIATIGLFWEALPAGLIALLIAAGIVLVLRWSARKLGGRFGISVGWSVLGFCFGAPVGVLFFWYLIVTTTQDT